MGNPVTMDMSVVDCQSGIMHCIKMGAVSTFIKREGWVEIIKSSTLPMGVLEQVDYDCTDKKLYDGDYVIMISDGVLDNLPCVNKEEKLVEIINSVRMKKPKAIADEILKSQWGIIMKRFLMIVRFLSSGCLIHIQNDNDVRNKILLPLTYDSRISK